LDAKIQGYQTVSYRHPPSKKKDLDGYEQTPPQGGIPQTRQSELGRGRRIEQWQQLGPSFHFKA